jgi:hypothetical protein
LPRRTMDSTNLTVSSPRWPSRLCMLFACVFKKPHGFVSA